MFPGSEKAKLIYPDGSLRRGKNQVSQGYSGKDGFCASDVAKVLGYVNTRDAIAKHCKAANSVAIRDGQRGNPNTTIIPERDVYRLVMRSKLPAAEQFEEWVIGTVLPSIRKTGSYSVVGPQLPDFSNPATAARAWADEYEKRLTAEHQQQVYLEN